jgi:hypothetical protein
VVELMAPGIRVVFDEAMDDGRRDILQDRPAEVSVHNSDLLSHLRTEEMIMQQSDFFGLNPACAGADYSGGRPSMCRFP